MPGQPSLECECFRRMCLNYSGVSQMPAGKEFLHTCKAFPEGIPPEICAGKNSHANPIPGQSNTIVFEKASGYAEMEMFKSKRSPR